MKKAVSLYLTILILSVLTSSLLALVSISVSQIKIIWSAGDSVRAFYGADSGIEQALFRIRQQSNSANFSGTAGSASYQVSITAVGEEITIKSVGLYRNAKRAVETRY